MQPAPPNPPPSASAPDVGDNAPAGVPTTRGREASAASGEFAQALDWTAAAMAVGLAFLLASFPARNSDLWLHLASGRALLHGEQALGTDPFSHTTAGERWVNHAWLFDLLGYALYRGAGGDALVLAKALLSALLAGLLLHACWRGPARSLAVLAVALALVALGPYLQLRPAVLSYLFLAGTLWWLVRRTGGGGSSHPAPPSAARALVSHLPLLLAFALWANLDHWFFLGPLTVVLFWLGQAVEHRGDATGSPVAGTRGLGVVAVVAILMPLLTPHHVHALRWPEALSGAGAGGAWGVLTGASSGGTAGLTPARVAWLALLLLSGVALVLNRRRPAWSLVFLWAAALAAGLFLEGGAPFFAIVAGLVAGVQLQTFAAGRATTTAADERPPVARAALIRRAGPVLLLAAGLMAAWPGWLQDQIAQPRGWAVEMDPSLERMGVQLARWHEEGLAPATARGFNLSTDAAHTLAWVAPREKTFYDGRPGLFPRDVRDDFLAVRRALLEPAAEGEAGPDWRAVLRSRGISHVIVHDANDRGLANAVRVLFAAPDEWRLAHLAGRALIFARPDTGQPANPGWPEVDLGRRAFQPSADERAPPRGLREQVQARTWADAFVTPAGPLVPDGAEALLYLSHFEARRPAHLDANRRLWEAGAVAGLVGLNAPGGAAPSSVPGSALRFTWLKVSREPVGDAPGGPARALDLAAYAGLSAYLAGRDDGPPGSLLLAVRAARRALAAEPRDPVTHLLLGRAYLRLAHNTRERAAQGSAPVLEKVRVLQAAAALKDALRLNPDLVQAHESLARAYSAAGQWELALQHVREAVTGNRVTGPAAGEGAEAFTQRLRRLEADEAELARRVSDLAISAKARSLNVSVVREAQVAHELGLSARALTLLRGADVASLGQEGVVLRVQLALLAGDAEEARLWGAPEHEATLGAANHRWLRVQLAAAAGDYAEADAALRAMSVDGVEVPELKLRNAPVVTVVALLVGKSALEGAALQRLPFSGEPAAVTKELEKLVTTFRHQADLATLRGLLALEFGDAENAAGAFRHSLSQWRSEADGPTFLARRYLDLIQDPGRD